MTNIWVASDHHFGHRNILRFTDYDGNLIRGAIFKDIEEHDETIIAKHNAVVRPSDHVYLLGDLVINRRSLGLVKRLTGKLRLVRGNHDIFRTKEYIEAGIEEIYGVRVWPKHNFIFSHIPLHPACLEGRGWSNIHGHLHANVVRLDNGLPDGRYQCVSLEHTDYAPVLVMT